MLVQNAVLVGMIDHCLHPDVGTAFTDHVTAIVALALRSPEANDDPCRNAARAQHQRQCRRVTLAVSFLDVDEEVLNGIDRPVLAAQWNTWRGGT